ncbi:hypothetical protein D4Q80_02745 [bacterium]|nr:MAG: hypothetical protein D4Q80_02745 [bacterium]
MKILERSKAVELRKQGMTFSEILKEIPVSKSSLSYWLRDVPLTNEQIARIKYKNDDIKDKFMKFNELRKMKAEEHKRQINNSAIQDIGSISLRELKLIGIALYWAEGYKSHARNADFVNTDPAMIRLMMCWFRKVCKVQEDKFRIRLQIHNVADIDKAQKFWSEITGISLNQFTRAYVKTSPTSKKKSGNLAPYGICAIRIFDIDLINRIKGWITSFTALSSSPV